MPTEAKADDILNAGGGPWSMELAPWPLWKQGEDWTADGRPDENKFNNCGPECVAEVISHLCDVELPADYIHDVVRGEGYHGYLSLADLALFLQKYVKVECKIERPVTKNVWLWTIWKQLTLGHPMIGLFSFTKPGSFDGHFRCVVGMGNDPHVVLTADPWTGKKRRESWTLAWEWAKGPLLLVDRRRAIGK